MALWPCTVREGCPSLAPPLSKNSSTPRTHHIPCSVHLFVLFPTQSRSPSEQSYVGSRIMNCGDINDNDLLSTILRAQRTHASTFEERIRQLQDDEATRGCECVLRTSQASWAHVTMKTRSCRSSPAIRYVFLLRLNAARSHRVIKGGISYFTKPTRERPSSRPFSPRTFCTVRFAIAAREECCSSSV